MKVIFVNGRMQVLDDNGDLHQGYYEIKRNLETQLAEDMYRHDDNQRHTPR